MHWTILQLSLVALIIVESPYLVNKISSDLTVSVASVIAIPTLDDVKM
jgi:hypothetical protein